MSNTLDTSSSSSVDAPAANSVDYAYTWLREKILAMELRPGEKISQVRLAKTLNISRTPLREALGKLIAEGLVTSDFNRQIQIAELDLDDFDEIYALRFAIEPPAALATIPRLTSQEKTQLTDLVAAMDETFYASQYPVFRNHHRKFHMLLLKSVGARVQQLISDNWDYSERYRVEFIEPYSIEDNESVDRFEAAQQGHRDILASVLDGDAESASVHLENHMKHTLYSVYRIAGNKRIPEMSEYVLHNNARKRQPGL